MIDLFVIVIHQLLFQGMFVLKNTLLKKSTGKQIRGKNIEAVVSIIYFAFFIFVSLSISGLNLQFGRVPILEENIATILALGILAVNLVVSMLSLVHLKDSWRVGVIENQKTQLVVNGIYGFTRNPYFVTYILMFAAYTVLLQNLILFLLSFVGVILVHSMIVKEEKYLLSVHGEEYLKYKSKVPRYLMKVNRVRKLATVFLIIYFILSGIAAIVDIDSKLTRIGLAAISDDGRIAFGLIYTSLFVGIGLSMIVLWFLIRSTIYSLVVAGSVIASFIIFRLTGSIIVGQITTMQIEFIIVELIELMIIVYLILTDRQNTERFAG